MRCHPKSGRSGHDILAKSCGLCNCVNDTYGCNLKCCPREELDNNRFSLDDLKRLICDRISSNIPSTQNDLDSLISQLCNLSYPNFNCPIPLILQDPVSLDSLHFLTINNGSCVEVENLSFSITLDTDYDIFIDNVKCITIQFSLFGP